ncbi:hypothetical protein G6O67_005647 [Ophiocordyceps sinensis]|uniref:Heme haloperoxidase family profile domain-containing protein n=1 Tax=Ophiocordyceps sinensis TaxID=72228 RepID=A0A8H4PNA8_9HYPO|nr:hypothetical protein G6O67_005647 [Ophiocordyceps sinensis]
MRALACIVLSSLACTALASTLNSLLESYDQQWQSHDFIPPGPDDSRSPCPALNALANHGFLPHSGKGIGVAQVILALFFGIGVSPELSAIIIAFGIISSRNGLSFKIDLEDLAQHQFVIEHDCSFSRNDALVGDQNNFQMDLWEVALGHLNRSGVINPVNFGRAKAARVKDQRIRNPKTVYGARAWMNGALEVGLVTSAFGIVPGLAKLDVIRCVFEEERLPYHLGWRPKPFFTNTLTMLGVAAASMTGDPDAFGTAMTVLKNEPQELLEIFMPPTLDHLPELQKLIGHLGFDNGPMKRLTSLMNGISKHKKILRGRNFIGPMEK